MSVPLVATAALLRRDSDVVVSPMLPPKAANDQRLPSIRELLGDLDDPTGRVEKKRRSASMPSIEHEAAAAIVHQLQTAHHHQPQYSLHSHHHDHHQSESTHQHQRPSTPPGADRLQSLERQLHVLKQQKDILERMVAKQEHIQQQQRRHSVTGAVWTAEHQQQFHHQHQQHHLPHVPHSAHRATSPGGSVLSPNCPDLAAPHHQWAAFESGTRGTSFSVDLGVGPQPGYHGHQHHQHQHHQQHDPHRHHVPPQPLEQPHHRHQHAHHHHPYYAQQQHYYHHHQVQQQHAVVGHTARRMSLGPAERGGLDLALVAAAAAAASSTSPPPPMRKETSSSSSSSSSRKRKERALSAADEAALRAAAASVLEFHQYCPSCKKGGSGETTRPCTCGRRASLGGALSRGASSSDVIADVQDDGCLQLERSRSPSTTTMTGSTSAEEGPNRSRDGGSFKRRKSVASLPTAPPRTKHVTFHKLEFM